MTLITGKGFESSVLERGLGYAALDVDLLEFAQSPEGKAALAGKNLLGTIKRLIRDPLEGCRFARRSARSEGARVRVRYAGSPQRCERCSTRYRNQSPGFGIMPAMRRTLDDEWRAARGADAIVYHPKALGGYHIAEALGVPGFLAHPVPAFSPTRAFPTPVLPFANPGGFFNKMSYEVLFRSISAPYHRMINRWRSESLGLPPRRFLASELELRGGPIRRLYCCSPRVVPVPADWDASTTVTGYWFLDHPGSWRPPAHLAGFLAAGPPPVYVGFGPTVRDPERSHAVALAALRESGQRGVLATGHTGLPLGASNAVCVIESAPHGWLFPRMAAVVHHGGAGTTAEGLRAGRPTVVCPSFGDQPFWGRRVHGLGAGPEPVPQRELTVGRLATAIRAVAAKNGMRRRAAGLGEKIRAEDGVARAIEIIDARLSKQSLG